MTKCNDSIKGHTLSDVLSLFKTSTGCMFFGNVEDHSKSGIKETILRVDEIIAAQATDQEVRHIAAQKNISATLCRTAEDMFLTFRLWLSVQTWDQRRVTT